MVNGKPIMYLVEGIHWSVPGKVMSLHRTVLGAARFAAGLVNVMLKDLNMPQDAQAGTWGSRLIDVQAAREELECCTDEQPEVWITELDVSE